MKKMKKHVLQWHIIHVCNLRCTHCYQDDYINTLSYADCMNVLKQYKTFCEKYHYKGHINFTGGEPLLYPNLFDVLTACEHFGFTFGLLTNGTLLTEDIAEKLSSFKNLCFVQISIDGTRKIHDGIRGTGNFDKAFHGIKLLNKFGIETMVSFTCHKSNYKDLKRVIHYCRHHGVDRFWADRLIPFGNNTESVLSTSEYDNVIQTLTDESKKKGMVVHTNRALQWIHGSNTFYHCSAGVSLLVLLADGTLLPCRRLPIIIGNIFETDMIELYETSPVIKELSKETIPDGCKGCLHAKLCRGGAKCLSYALTGDYNIRDVNCSVDCQNLHIVL